MGDVSDAMGMEAVMSVHERSELVGKKLYAESSGLKAQDSLSEKQAEKAHASVPTPKPPDEYGESAYENMMTYTNAGKQACNGMQEGTSRMMCDLYCTENAVRKGDEAVNKNIGKSHKVMMNNFEKLLNYHTKTISWELKYGKVVKDASFFLWQQASPGRDLDLQASLTLLSALPDLLMKNKTLPHGTMEWHQKASSELVDRVESVVRKTEPKTARESLSKVNTLMQKFHAECELRLQQPSQSRPQAVADMTYKKSKIMQGRAAMLRARIRTAVIVPKPMHFSGWLENDEVVVRWNQLADYFVAAHEKHNIFAESRYQVLDKSEYIARRANQYVSCGSDLGGLQLAWEDALHSEERAADTLLEAWAATVATQERLHMAIDQGLVDRVIDATSVSNDPDSQPSNLCNDPKLLMERVHQQAVLALDHALWPLTEQVFALEKLAQFQQQEMQTKQLHGVQAWPLDEVAFSMYSAASEAADPSSPKGKILLAKFMDVIGPRLCPASRGCPGVMLTNSSFGTLVATRLGDLFRGEPVDRVVAACRTPETHSLLQDSDSTMNGPQLLDALLHMPKQMEAQMAKVLWEKARTEGKEEERNEEMEHSGNRCMCTDKCEGTCEQELLLATKGFAPQRSVVVQLWKATFRSGFGPKDEALEVIEGGAKGNEAARATMQTQSAADFEAKTSEHRNLNIKEDDVGHPGLALVQERSFRGRAELPVM